MQVQRQFSISKTYIHIIMPKSNIQSSLLTVNFGNKYNRCNSNTYQLQTNKISTKSVR